MNTGQHRTRAHPAPPLVEAVIFDLFHTLIDMRHAPAETSTPELLGIDPAVWSHTVTEASPRHALGEDPDPMESVRRIAHAIDPTISMERVRAAVAARPERFRAAFTRVSPDALSMLERLRGMGLPLGLISNAGLDEIEGWAASPLAPFFDVALFSCREKVMKPDPRIYRLAAERLGVAPERCLYAGDGASREHEGAREAGMRTVLMLAILNEIDPPSAAARKRDTDWVVESFSGFTCLVERLRRQGSAAATERGPASRDRTDGGPGSRRRTGSTSNRCTHRRADGRNAFDR